MVDLKKNTTGSISKTGQGNNTFIFYILARLKLTKNK